jgi:hypothetical protein
MKVKIGKYPSLLRCSVFSDYMNKKYGYVAWPTTYSKFETILEKIEDAIQVVYNIPNKLYFDNKRQAITVQIDPWDTYSMDHTAALVILPMLKQLKETKQGAPHVDDKDVPRHLRTPPGWKQSEQFKNHEIDSNHFKRWDWVMDEMIFAFETKIDESFENQFYSGEHDIVWTKEEGNDLFRMERGPNDTFKIDMIGLKKFNDRVKNGFSLFGKYYEALWD